MNKQEQEYFRYLTNMGYSPIYNEEKSSFLIKEHSIYLKCCEYPASPEIIKQAKKASEKFTVILLEGNLTFRDYPFFDGEWENESGCFLVHAGSKYSPIYYGGSFDEDCFPEEFVAIAKAINNKPIPCKRCGEIDNYKIEHNVHYKAVCKGCNSFITNVSSNKPLIIHFGKYQGRRLDSMTTKEEILYLDWAVKNNVFSNKLKDAAIELIKKS